MDTDDWIGLKFYAKNFKNNIESILSLVTNSDIHEKKIFCLFLEIFFSFI